MDLATPAIIPALLTPFRPDGAVDRDALRAHVGWLIDHRVDAVMPCGTTGETALLSDDEVLEVVEAVIAAAGGRVPVIAHVGRPGTLPTIELGRRALGRRRGRGRLGRAVLPPARARADPRPLPRADGRA